MSSTICTTKLGVAALALLAAVEKKHASVWRGILCSRAK
jgi:hypothetical protein